MKKNKMMRLASVLLVAVLLTTSIISGTFAKYVTTGEAEDNARVAKFGVTVEANGFLFAKNYFMNTLGETNNQFEQGKNMDEANILALTVESSNGDNLVAPGTKNTKGLTFSFTGKPEVDVKISLAIADDYQDIFLAKNDGVWGKYVDRTTQATGDYFTLSEDYYPIEYTLTNNGTELVKGTLAEIAEFLNTYEVYVDANTDLSEADYTYTLTWEWVFGDAENNQADTFLGDLAAGTTTGLDGYYSLDTDVTIAATVAQVD